MIIVAINWFSPTAKYISITTNEETNPVWGLDWALDHGATEVNTWNSLSDFFDYLSTLIEGPDPDYHDRTREIAIYPDGEHFPEIFNRLNVPIKSPFIHISNLLNSKPFEKYLIDWIENRLTFLDNYFYNL